MIMNKYTKLNISSFQNHKKNTVIFWNRLSKFIIYCWSTVYQRWLRRRGWTELSCLGIIPWVWSEEVKNSIKEMFSFLSMILLMRFVSQLSWGLDNFIEVLKKTGRRGYWRASIWSTKTKEVTGPFSMSTLRWGWIWLSLWRRFCWKKSPMRLWFLSEFSILLIFILTVIKEIKSQLIIFSITFSMNDACTNSIL